MCQRDPQLRGPAYFSYTLTDRPASTRPSYIALCGYYGQPLSDLLRQEYSPLPFCTGGIFWARFE